MHYIPFKLPINLQPWPHQNNFCIIHRLNVIILHAFLQTTENILIRSPTPMQCLVKFYFCIRCCSSSLFFVCRFRQCIDSEKFRCWKVSFILLVSIFSAFVSSAKNFSGLQSTFPPKPGLIELLENLQYFSVHSKQGALMLPRFPL